MLWQAVRPLDGASEEKLKAESPERALAGTEARGRAPELNLKRVQTGGRDQDRTLIGFAAPPCIIGGTMKLRVLLLLWIGVSSSRAADDAPIAFLKGPGLYVTDATGENPRRLDHDARSKSKLRWDGYRRRISYLVPREHGESGEMAIIVELDSAGNIAIEAPIPHDDGMRFVEDFEWLPNGNARLGGSVNPRNCVLYDLDPETGKITNGVDGKCSSFVRAPDGKHTAELGVIPQTDEDHRFDAVDFDSPPDFQPAAYGGGGHHVFIPAGPVWSPDSQSVVFVEKRADTGEAGVVFLTLAKVATRVPVPAFVLENPSIEWVGSKVVTGQGDKAVQIDPVTKQLSGVTSDISDEMARRASAKRTVEAAHAKVDDQVKRMGGREGIVLDAGGAQ